MNLNRIARLYDALTNRERAALAFDSLVEGNEEELENIKASIPRQTITGPVLEYSKWFDAFWNVSSYVAIEYWRIKALTHQAFCGYYILSRRDEFEKSEIKFEEFISGHRSVLALNNALDLVCTKYGLNPEAVRKFVGMDANEKSLHGKLEADEEIVGIFRKKLSGVIESSL